MTPAGVQVRSEAAAGSRLMGFDLVRAFAAISVIWVHAGRSEQWHALNLSDLGRWGTAFLNMLAAFFLVMTMHKFLAKQPGVVGAAKFSQHRLIRIGAPFVVWSLVYLAARGVNYVVFGKVTTLQVSPMLFVHGTTYHLWFLPYLIVISTLVTPLVYWALGSVARMRWVGAACLVAAVAVLLNQTPSWMSRDAESIAGFVSTVYTRSPAFLIGLAFGLLYVSKVQLRVPLALGLAGGLTAVFAAGCAAVATNEPVDMVWYRVAAVGAFVLALMPWRGLIAESGAKLGTLGFGVYLCHVLFVEFGHAAAGAVKMASGLSTDVCVFLFAVVASFAFAALMRRTKALSWLIP